MHRPFVGVTIQQYRTEGTPPSLFDWKFVLKNSGSLPAWGRVEELHVLVTQAAQAHDVANPSPFNKFFLMPQETADITGRVVDPPGQQLVSEILAGRSQLTVSIRVAYEPGGGLWWKSHYYYLLRSGFTTQAYPPGFTIISAEAN